MQVDLRGGGVEEGYVWCSGNVHDLKSKGCEFEPCYNQCVLNLPKSLHLAWFVDLSDIWYAVRGMLQSIGTDKLSRDFEPGISGSGKLSHH